MKKLIALVAFVLLGLSVRASAMGYFTYASSGVVCITTAPNMEVTFISISSGTSVLGDVYAVIIDSNPLGLTSGAASPGVIGTMLPLTNFSETTFPASQWLLPPVVAVTTHTASQSLFSYTKLTSETGDGISIKKGLCVSIFSNSGVYGEKVTIGYRERVGRWER